MYLLMYFSKVIPTNCEILVIFIVIFAADLVWCETWSLTIKEEFID